MKTIVLDPGHGGHDSGALSPTGLRESDVVLDVAKRVREILAPRCHVALTREDDRFFELRDRARFANKIDGAWFLSLHCNSATTDASGIEIFTSPGQTASDPFATDIFEAYAAEFPHLKARKDLRDGDPDKEAKFTVLTATHGPAALLELEFIHTPFGDAFFSSPSNLERMARAIAAGITKHLDLDDLNTSTSNIAKARKHLLNALAELG